MVNKMSEEAIYEEAKKRVKAKKDFYVHLVFYVCVNIFLIIIWAFPAGGGFPWFIFPLGGWGIGLVIHFLSVFVFEGKSDKPAIEKEAEKIRRELNLIRSTTAPLIRATVIIANMAWKTMKARCGTVLA